MLFKPNPFKTFKIPKIKRYEPKPYFYVQHLPKPSICPMCDIEESMSDKSLFNLTEWQKYKNQLTHLEKNGDGQTKVGHQIRSTLISLWNKLTPEQQKEMALKYIPQTEFSS